MWDHVAHFKPVTGDVILRDPRYRPLRYKAGLYLDRSEVFREAIAAALLKPGDDVIVDDPRGVAVALGRRLGQLPRESVSPQPPAFADDATRPSEAELIAALRSADDWNHVAMTDADK